MTWRLYSEKGTHLPHDQGPTAAAIRSNRPVRDTVTMAERPDGTRLLFISYATPIILESGAVVGAVNLLVDITDRRAFTLPYRCDCGASGRIKYAIYDDLDAEPRPVIARIDGPFRVAGEPVLACLICGGSSIAGNDDDPR